MHVDWLAALLRSDFHRIKATCLNLAQKLDNLPDEFGWEMPKLLWKHFEKLLLSKKLFYFQTSQFIHIYFREAIFYYLHFLCQRNLEV